MAVAIDLGTLLGLVGTTNDTIFSLNFGSLVIVFDTLLALGAEEINGLRVILPALLLPLVVPDTSGATLLALGSEVMHGLQVVLPAPLLPLVPGALL